MLYYLIESDTFWQSGDNVRTVKTIQIPKVKWTNKRGKIVSVINNMY